MSPASRPRRTFGRTWWGRAWVDALEQRARLDPNRLPRGRTYARHARVGALTVEPGEVRAPVLGSRASAYRVRVRVRAFTSAEWDAVLDAITARAGHAAALLDGELTPEIVEDVAAAGLDLLPGPGEVGTSCSCPDWANPCKHAAAVCYLVADHLDDDPFALLALRGRTRDEVLAALRARRSAGTSASAVAEATAVDAGVDARAAWSAASRPPLPSPPMPPERPGRPVPVAVDPQPEAGVRLDQVVALAADAARRAWELATGAGDGGLGLGRDADLARRAAAALGTPALGELAVGAGLPGRRLVALATAWERGGAGAVAVLADHPPAPPAEVLESARRSLAVAGRQVRLAGVDVSVVGSGARLRYGTDGLWYRLERRAGTWEVAAAPDADPLALVEV